jgi:hypothetical protein
MGVTAKTVKEYLARIVGKSIVCEVALGEERVNDTTAPASIC